MELSYQIVIKANQTKKKMSKFIQVRDKGGSNVYVNIDNIVSFEDNKSRDMVLIHTTDAGLFPLDKSSQYYILLRQMIIIPPQE